MRSRSLLLILLVLGLPLMAPGQDFTTKQLIVSLPEGGFVSFKNQTAWTDLRQAFDLRKLPAALGSQAVADRNQTIHRVLRDNDGKFVFGYDLWINGDAATKQFKISVKPLDPELQNTLRVNDQTPLNDSISTFPKPTEPQILDDGAEFSLDLLINKNTGVKIIDVVKVTFDRLRLENDSPRMRPRDFTLEAVALEMKDYSLLVNDSLIATSKSKTGCAGTLLWVYIPNRGRFIFSLFPRDGYAFQKAGTVAGNKIEFTLKGDRYQWLSSSPILREEGSWNLWVLHDAQYSPLFAVRQPPPTEKSALEKLDELVNSTLQKGSTALKTKPSALLVGPDPKKVEKPAVTPREKVMMGGADRIENLLPRN
jgi:hypothetical protein